jgi:hypothetical protein
LICGDNNPSFTFTNYGQYVGIEKCPDKFKRCGSKTDINKSICIPISNFDDPNHENA